MLYASFVFTLEYDTVKSLYTLSAPVSGKSQVSLDEVR